MEADTSESKSTLAAIGENWQQQILYNINGNTYTKFQLFPWHVRYTSGDLGEGHDLSSVAFSSSPTRLTQRRVRFDRYKRNASLSPPSNELANVTISLLVPRSRPHEVKQRAMSSNRHAVPTPRKFFSSQTQIFPYTIRIFESKQGVQILNINYFLMILAYYRDHYGY